MAVSRYTVGKLGCGSDIRKGFDSDTDVVFHDTARVADSSCEEQTCRISELLNGGLYVYLKKNIESLSLSFHGFQILLIIQCSIWEVYDLV